MCGQQVLMYHDTVVEGVETSLPLLLSKYTNRSHYTHSSILLRLLQAKVSSAHKQKENYIPLFIKHNDGPHMNTYTHKLSKCMHAVILVWKRDPKKWISRVHISRTWDRSAVTSLVALFSRPEIDGQSERK